MGHMLGFPSLLRNHYFCVSTPFGCVLVGAAAALIGMQVYKGRQASGGSGTGVTEMARIATGRKSNRKGKQLDAKYKRRMEKIEEEEKLETSP